MVVHLLITAVVNYNIRLERQYGTSVLNSALDNPQNLILAIPN